MLKQRHDMIRAVLFQASLCDGEPPRSVEEGVAEMRPAEPPPSREGQCCILPRGKILEALFSVMDRSGHS